MSYRDLNWPVKPVQADFSGILVTVFVFLLLHGLSFKKNIRSCENLLRHCHSICEE